MLQTASLHLILSEASEDLIASEPWSMETYADGLMDELFADIDQILNGSSKLQATYSPFKEVTVPQVVLPKTSIQPVQGSAKDQKHQLSTVVVHAPAVSKPSNKQHRLSWHLFLRLLILGSTVGVAIAGMTWLLNSGILNRLVSKSLPEALLYHSQLHPQITVINQVDAEADLVNYMLAALEVIERQEANNSTESIKTARVPAPQNTLANVSSRSSDVLPPPLTTNNTTPASNRSTNVVERIYIPVYQAPQPMRYAPPPISPELPKALQSGAQVPGANSKNSSAAKPVKTALNSLPKPAKPVTVNAMAAVRSDLKPLDVKTAPVIVRPTPKVKPSDLPSPVASTKSSATATPVRATSSSPHQQQVVAVIPATPVASHVLEGLLELGDKSAALFKIDGVTRRFEIGESIGSSGWMLVDVTQGEAIIRRNGEVRSIYTGQSF